MQQPRIGGHGSSWRSTYSDESRYAEVSRSRKNIRVAAKSYVTLLVNTNDPEVIVNTRDRREFGLVEHVCRPDCGWQPPGFFFCSPRPADDFLPSQTARESHDDIR